MNVAIIEVLFIIPLSAINSMILTILLKFKEEHEIWIILYNSYRC